MKSLLIALLILSSGAWATSNHPSTGVIVHKRTDNFIDVEAPVGQVWVGCSKDHPKNANSFLTFYILDGDTTYDFFYRAAIHNVPMCHEAEREYRKLIKGAKTVRIVGILPDETAGPETPMTKRTPKRFSASKKFFKMFFVRLQANGRCKAYFSSHCDLPENYWAGTTPNYKRQVGP